MKPMMKRLLSAALVLTLLAGTTITAAAEGAIKSQGNWIFMNGEAAFYASDLRYLNDKVEEQIVAITAGKGKIAEAVKTKDSTATVTSASTFDELCTALKKIGNDGTAGAADVVSGKKIYNGTGYTTGTLALTGNATEANVLSGTTFYSNTFKEKTGAMANYSGRSQSVTMALSGTTGTVSIPVAGYYDTTSKLSFSIDPSAFFNPTGTAVAAQVLSGQTFYSNSSTLQTGTMANKSGMTQTAQITINGNAGIVSIPAAGYYDTTSMLTVDLTEIIEENRGLTNQESLVLLDSVSETGTQYERKFLFKTGVLGKDLGKTITVCPWQQEHSLDQGGGSGRIRDIEYDPNTGDCTLTVYSTYYSSIMVYY